jgi:hypothetical protein
MLKKGAISRIYGVNQPAGLRFFFYLVMAGRLAAAMD